MIFLRAPGLIFLKSKKTAGTSVEIALSCNAASDDIVTPLLLPDEVIRLETGGRPSANWACNHADEVSFNALAVAAMNRKRSGLPVDERSADKARALFFNHMTPTQIVEQLGRDAYDAALKVTICRHPYEQIVSRAYWRLRNRPAPLDPAAVSAEIDVLLSRPAANADFFWFDGGPAADIVLRYEHLSVDLAELEVRCGLALVSNLPNTKSMSRHDRRPAAEILTEAQRRLCLDVHRREFEMFGYSD